MKAIVHKNKTEYTSKALSENKLGIENTWKLIERDGKRSDM